MTNPSEHFKSTNILVITSYPERECGIATFSQDLVSHFNSHLDSNVTMCVCALENELISRYYPPEVKYILHTKDKSSYAQMAYQINADEDISSVVIQHEFGLFSGHYGKDILSMLRRLKKPVYIVFHTVLPEPNLLLKKTVKRLCQFSSKVVTMTHNSRNLLQKYYGIDNDKIAFIPHGTHAVEIRDRDELKQKYRFEGRTVLSTFGLISANKNIENTLLALPSIIQSNPEVLFLIMGKTHPEVVKREGEIYRGFLNGMVEELGLQKHVEFIDEFLELDKLIELLQLTDVYVFSSKDRNQAVSGTFSYALSCGCPVIATAIPHAEEYLSKDEGILIDFENPYQLSEAVQTLLKNASRREQMRINALHRSKATVWQNCAIKYAQLLQATENLRFNLPEISLRHLVRLTQDFGVVQFSKINVPDRSSGYTLDDNARALIAVCMDFELTRNTQNYLLIEKYLRFIGKCQHDNGRFINYFNTDGNPDDKNQEENLDDANGRAIWALGTVVSYEGLLPANLVARATFYMRFAIESIGNISSPRAKAFCIKGLYLYNQKNQDPLISRLIDHYAEDLVEKYHASTDKDWHWFEDSLTYSNSVLPEALLYAYKETNKEQFAFVAKQSFDFLLTHVMPANEIKVISNNGWHSKWHETYNKGGEQPIDVAYTILSLILFDEIYPKAGYGQKVEPAFHWFLGQNHLNQLIYDPTSGGCCDGLEQTNVNLNQGAESSICYLLARLGIEKMRDNKKVVFQKIKPANKEIYFIEATETELVETYV